MKIVRWLTKEQRTCIAAIHQPAPEVFELFNSVVLSLTDGKVTRY